RNYQVKLAKTFEYIAPTGKRADKLFCGPAFSAPHDQKHRSRPPLPLRRCYAVRAGEADHSELSRLARRRPTCPKPGISFSSRSCMERGGVGSCGRALCGSREAVLSELV